MPYCQFRSGSTLGVMASCFMSVSIDIVICVDGKSLSSVNIFGDDLILVNLVLRIPRIHAVNADSGPLAPRRPQIGNGHAYLRFSRSCDDDRRRA